MKKSIMLLLCVLTIKAHSQDSLQKNKSVVTKRHEIGLNILPPFLVMSGVFGSQPKFLNTTYRYLLSDHNAFRATAGLNVFNSNSYNDQKEAVSITNGLTIYETTSKHTPANFMVGMGYERIMGKRKLKHVVGVDLTYNYVVQNTVSDYYGLRDTTINGNKQTDYVRIDTGRTVSHRYFNKIGITPFYSLRYALSSKWLFTASTRFNFQGYKTKNSPNPTSTVFDFNMDGLISEISLFYRF